MLIQYKIVIGLNDKDSQVQEITTLDAFKIITSLVGDCTIQEARGVYTHKNGTVTLENTLIVQVIDFDGSYNAEEVVKALKVALNQEAIILIKEVINSKMI